MCISSPGCDLCINTPLAQGQSVLDVPFLKIISLKLGFSMRKTSTTMAMLVMFTVLNCLLCIDAEVVPAAAESCLHQKAGLKDNSTPKRCYIAKFDEKSDHIIATGYEAGDISEQLQDAFQSSLGLTDEQLNLLIAHKCIEVSPFHAMKFPRLSAFSSFCICNTDHCNTEV